MGKIKLFCKKNKLSYITIADSADNKNILDIYIKFISYLKNDEIIFLNDLKNKDFFSLSQAEIDKYYRIRTQLNMVELFKKYKNKCCTKKEHDIVYEYMKNNSLKTFVRKKIDFDEKIKAYNIIKDLVCESTKKLKDYIQQKESEYDSLNIFDAYVLFEAKEYLYNNEQNKLCDDIKVGLLEKEKKLVKSSIRDY